MLVEDIEWVIQDKSLICDSVQHKVNGKESFVEKLPILRVEKRVKSVKKNWLKSGVGRNFGWQKTCLRQGATKEIP